jgi:crossover junction endodeoxyribonuclease RusA
MPGRKGISVLLSEKARKYKVSAEGEMLAQSVPRGRERVRYELSIDAYPPDRRRRDLDNILKPLLDVLEEYGALPDDEQIDILTVRRRGHKKPGYVTIRLSEIDSEDSLVA